MQFESLTEFVSMGGHGFYVWLAYGATLVVLLAYTLGIYLRRARLLKELKWTAALNETSAAADATSTENEQ